MYLILYTVTIGSEMDFNEALKKSQQRVAANNAAAVAQDIVDAGPEAVNQGDLAAARQLDTGNGSGVYTVDTIKRATLAQEGDNYHTVRLDINPETNALQLNAPQYFLESDYYKQSLEPELVKFNNLPANSPQIQNLLSEETLTALNDDSRNLFNANKLVNEYVKINPDAGREDAFAYYQNVGANRFDDSSLVVVGMDKSGVQQTATAKELFNKVSEFSDVEKQNYLSNVRDITESDKATERQKAVFQGILDFFQRPDNNEALNTSTGNTIRIAGERGTVALADSGFVGGIANALTGVRAIPIPGLGVVPLSSGDTVADQARENLENFDELNDTSKLSIASSIGNSVLGFGADLAAGGAIGKLIGSGLAATGRAAKLISTIDKATDVKTLQKVVGASDEAVAKAAEIVRSNSARTISQDLKFNTGFAVTQIPDNLSDADTILTKDVIVNTLQDVALIGTGRGVIKAGKIIGGTKSFNVANDFLSQKIVKANGVLSSTPYLGTGLKKIATGFVDGGSALVRLANGQYAATGDKYDLHRANNVIDYARNTGSTVDNIILESSKGGRALVQDVDGSIVEVELSARRGLNDFVESATEGLNVKKARELEQKYTEVGARITELERLENGAKNIKGVDAASTRAKTSAEINEIKKYLKENDSQEARDYLEASRKWLDEVNEIGVKLGITDEDLLNAFNAEEAYANYHRIQKTTDKSKNDKLRGSLPNTLKNSSTVDDITNKSFFNSDGEVMLLSLTADEKLDTIVKLASQASLHNLLAQYADQGIAGIRRVVDAGDVKKLDDLTKSNEKLSVLKNDIDKGIVADLEKALNQDADKILKAIQGKGGANVSLRIKNALNKAIDKVIEDSDFKQLAKGYRKDAGSRATNRQLATELVRENLGDVTNRIKLDNLTGTELSQVKAIYRAQIDELASADRITKTRTRREDEIAELRKKVDPNYKGNNTDNQVAYYSNGTKGRIEVDDPELLRALKSFVGADAGVVNAIMTSAARGFRAGTTALNPTFPAVDAFRNIGQANIAGGLNTKAWSNNLATDLAKNTGMDADDADLLMRFLETRLRSGTRVETSRRAQDLAQRSAKQVRLATGRNGDRVNRAKETVVGDGTIKGIANPKRILRSLEDSMNTIELRTRKQVAASRMIDAMNRGATKDEALQEAMFYAANATTKFLNVGDKVKSILTTMPYLNTAIQGPASFARLAKLDPIGTTARIMAGVIAPTMWLTTQNMSDPEKAEAYWSIPEYERENNLIIVLSPDEILKIPLPQEVLGFASVPRELIEGMYGYNQEGFSRIFVKGLLKEVPFGLDALADTDFTGETDYSRAFGEISSSFIPQAIRPIYENAIGSKVYSDAPIGPTEERLIRDGILDPEAQDYTFASKDSQTLRYVSQLTGVKQASIQNVFESYTGTVGGYLLGGIDRLLGAPDERVGGKSLSDDLGNRFIGARYDEANSSFWSGVNDLNVQRDKLVNQLDELASQLYIAELNGDTQLADSILKERQERIDNHAISASDFYNSYSDFYNTAGGISDFQVGLLLDTVNIVDPGRGSFDPGTAGASEANSLVFQGERDAQTRALQSGLPVTGNTSPLGIRTADGSESGNIGDGRVRTDRFEATNQLEFEFEEVAFRGDVSLSDVNNKYRPELNTAYEAEDYDKVDEIGERKNADLDKVIKPLVDKYGPNVLFNNQSIQDALDSYYHIPGEFTQTTSGSFFSSRRNPNINRTRGAGVNFIQDRYDVERFKFQETTSVPGRVADALSNNSSSKARDLIEDRDNGLITISEEDLVKILEII